MAKAKAAAVAGSAQLAVVKQEPPLSPKDKEGHDKKGKKDQKEEGKEGKDKKEKCKEETAQHDKVKGEKDKKEVSTKREDSHSRSPPSARGD